MDEDFRDFRAEMTTRLNEVHASINTIWATMMGGFAALIAAVILTQL